MTRLEASRRRRRWLTWSLRIAVATLLAIAVRGFIWEPSQLVERDHVLALPGWPASCDGLRLDVVADTHTGSPRNGLENLDRWVQRLVESDADAVLMAGDYVILSVFLGTYIPADVVARHLRPLTARKPVYAVLGNHDWWKDGPKVRDAFVAAGVRMIDDHAEAVELRGCRFWIAGLGDFLEGKPDVAGTFAMIGDDAPVVALTHGPDLFRDIPARAALTVAGHTHGGQIDPWPFPRHDPQPFVLGSPWLKWHVVDGDRHLFVTPGIGTSILPMRLGVPPEISRLTLRAQALPPAR
ncbi:metallophosphoesterase [Luteimonas vadosa]|uniref:Metallophosphoesterase n=1 Tax=Luteimonas vadosa TaxID=1165507 RepID=A0ABP9DVT0_9GAMM